MSTEAKEKGFYTSSDLVAKYGVNQWTMRRVTDAAIPQVGRVVQARIVREDQLHLIEAELKKRGMFNELAKEKTPAAADWQAMVREFHVKFGCTVNDRPTFEVPRKVAALRTRLHEEELFELNVAMDHNDLEEIADALADSIYVLLGTAVTYGIDLAPIFAEVHRTNMAKDGGATREDGKILKPEGWQPPDIAGLIEKQRGGA